MDDTLLSILPNLLFIIPQIIILVACITYLNHKKSSSGILLLVGAIIGLLSSLLHSVIIPLLMLQTDMDLYSGSVNVLMFSTPIAFIGAILFAIGLLLLIQEKIKLQKSM